MKRKIHKELLATSALAIIVTLLFAMFAFYGLFKEQVLGDLRAEAKMLRDMHVLDNVEDIHPDTYEMNPDSLRISVISRDGKVIFDSSADTSGMENHEARPEVKDAFLTGEGHRLRRSETLDKNLFYYAVSTDRDTVIRISREADSFLAVFQNMIPSVGGVMVILFLLCIILANYFTKSIVEPIDRLAETLSDPETEAVYKELVPFVATIRKQHQDILKNAQMRQEFTANVSHELKTPLTAISGYSELIKHGLAGEEDTVRFAGEIQKNASRLLTLINDIIQLSELDSSTDFFHPVEVDLYEMAAGCIDMLELNAEKMDVSMELTGHPAVVCADRKQMEELIYNLVDNAIRYNYKGGSVTVNVTGTEDQVVLSVSDTGIGIPEEHRERIFERFYRVDKSRSKETGGTGLGLAIVKHIISRHGAQLSLENPDSGGTVIRVTFPLKRTQESD